jgi:mono/diheme cytochrome c family protein
MLKKILTWTASILLFLLVGLSIVVAFRQNLHFDAPYPEISASKDSMVIARGKYLVFGPAHCADCHASPQNSAAIDRGETAVLSGGRLFNLPIGKIYSRNLTSDETGLGRISDEQIARALRYGVGHDGRTLFNFMPFHNASDYDLTAIISFIRSFPPVKNVVPANEMNLLGKVVKAFLIKPVGPSMEVPKAVVQDSSIEYGKYLASSVSNCRGCHTNRNLMTGAFVGPEYAGGFKMESVIDPKNFSCVTPNLTPDPATGHINAWSESLFIQRFRSGKLIPHSPMPWGPFSRMSDLELKAIYRFLKQVEPVSNDTGASLVSNNK